MTIWHKPTEKPRRKKGCTIVVEYKDSFSLKTCWNYNLWYVVCEKWCYLSDLLKVASKAEKLEKELKELRLDYVHQGRILGTLQADYRHSIGEDWEFVEEY